MPAVKTASAADLTPIATRRQGILLATLSFAMVGIALTWAAMSWIESRALESRRMLFDRYNAKIESTVTQRFEDSLVALKGLRATLHAYGSQMDQQTFRTWVDQRYIDHDFTGLRGLGFIERVEREDLPRFLSRVRADSAPDFEVRTSGNAADLLVIKFIEPLQRNRAAWGYDIGSESVRRAAAQTAIDTGRPTLTGRVTLVQDGKKGPGFLYFMPVYWLGAPVNTVEERRKALVGLLYTPFVAQELLAGVEQITDGLVDFELLEAKGQAPENVLFDLDGHLSRPDHQDEPGSLKHSKTVLIGGRPLTMQTRTTAAFTTETRDNSHLAAGAAGLLLSGLFAGVFWLTSMSRIRAEALAHQMTQDLRASKREVEAALRDQRALLDTLDRHSLISVTDRSGTILEVNDAFCSISGHNREALIGNTHRLINSGHHDPFFWIDMWETISSGKSWQGEICNRAKDGHLYWVSSIIAPLVGEDGRIEKYISIRQDISSRKKLEEDAIQMTERYTLAIEGGHDGLWDWVDVHGQAEWWSPQFYRMLGYQPDEIPASLVTFDNLLHPKDQSRTFKAIDDALRQRKPFDIEYRLRTKSGDHRWFRSRAKVYFDEFGTATRMAGSIQDIHERKLAQAQLGELIDQMSAIFSLTPDAFVSFDNLHQVSYVSPAFETLTGLKGEEARGLSEGGFIELLDSLCREPKGNNSWLTQPDDSKEEGRALLELRAPPGRVLAASMQSGTGSTVSKVVHLRDVTRELELDRMKGEFMSMAAHELRTPMASIYGFTELLLTREVKPEKQRDLLQRIFRQSEVMVSIINELLDLARIEARQGKDFKPTRFDLVRLVTSVVSDQQLPPGREAPQVASTDAPMWVHADAQKTHQAVLNVLTNAYKYSPAGGSVDIEFVTRTASDSHTRKEPCLGVRITDHGIGLTPEQLARIGERFYRADKSGNIPGTGLGMSIVKEILALMGGELDIESVHGEGTTVTLWLPTAESSAETTML